MIVEEKQIDTTQCYHCGDDCLSTIIESEDKSFCCHGCKIVYELLDENDLCTYYDLESRPGLRQKAISETKFDYLAQEAIAEKLLDFYSDDLNKVTFYIPAIHCSSCIYLLEHLSSIDEGVITSKINFTDKVLALDFDPKRTDLKAIVLLLAQLGYEPDINLNSTSEKKDSHQTQDYLKLGVAGFCFGNIMLLSFPDYFGFEVADEFRLYFTYISLVLSLPVLFFSSSEYFTSAISGLQKKHVSINVPIALGIFSLFARSLYEVATQSGSGYFDSLAGLVFFLLIGKWFQDKTYQNLTFNRDYTSYFPLSTTRVSGEKSEPVMVNDLLVGDTILVRNEEIIPADAIQRSESARIDYSFVTGESDPITSKSGSKIFAGGRIKGTAASFEVIKPVSQNYLTALWNNDQHQKEETKSNQLIDKISLHFTFAILGFALLSGMYWVIVDATQAVFVFTAVLIVACPCALALATPFTLGTVLDELGRQKLYLKSTQVIETLWRINHIVFDKTGTITTNATSQINYSGRPVTSKEQTAILALTQNSTHPISSAIHTHLSAGRFANSDCSKVSIEGFREISGKGIEGTWGGNTYRLGAAQFVDPKANEKDKPNGSHAYLSIDGELIGDFGIKNTYRTHISALIKGLQGRYSLSVLSGDNAKEKARLSTIFPTESNLHFHQKPEDKLNHINRLKESGDAVMMIGDGLNDAGALRASDFAIAITDDIAAFTPASDAILQGSQLHQLAALLQFVSRSQAILKTAFALSFLYNIVGLSFAASGHLTPIFAAILMPLSSITIVVFSSLSVKWLANSYFRKSKTHFTSNQ